MSNRDVCKDCDMAEQVGAICEICTNADRYKAQVKQLQAELEKHRWIPVGERLPIPQKDINVWWVLKNGIPEHFRSNGDSALWKGFAGTYTHWKLAL